MDFLITDLMSAFWKIAEVLSVPFIIIGVLNCFFGYKIFRIMCAINGFLTGAIPGAFLGMIAGLIGGEPDGNTIMVSALIGGIVGAVLAYAVRLIAVFFYCFEAGALLGIIFMIISRNYSGIFQSAVIWGLLFGVLGVLLAKTMIILLTAIYGALYIGMGFFLLMHSGLSAGAAAILSFALGLVVQSRNSGAKVPSGSYQPGQTGANTSMAAKAAVPVVQEPTQNVEQEMVQSAVREPAQSIVQETVRNVEQETVQSVVQKVQNTSQEAKQSEHRDREQEIRDMAQKAQCVMQETKGAMQETLKKAKKGSGKYIAIGTEHGKKAEAKIEKGILFLQNNVENVWDYFEKNKKALFPIMCAALVVASIIALL